jgi:hypothetical protein
MIHPGTVNSEKINPQMCFNVRCSHVAAVTATQD